MNATVHLASKKYIVKNVESAASMLLCDVLNTSSNEIEKFELDLAGLYQSKNLCTVLTAAEVLNKNSFKITEDVLHKALQQVKKITGLRGRWDIIQTDPMIILDVGHNEDGLKQVLQQLQKNYPSSNYHFVIGFVNDKDVNKLLPLFPKNAGYYFTNAHIPRALPYKTLQQLAESNSLEGKGYNDVNDAIRAAKLNAAKKDVIMVCGSFFIIAEVNLEN